MLLSCTMDLHLLASPSLFHHSLCAVFFLSNLLDKSHLLCLPQVLEVLSHVNKRVKGVSALQLPLAQLLALFSEPGQAPLVRNFALVYTETAFERANAAERLTVVSMEQMYATPHAFHLTAVLV